MKKNKLITFVGIAFTLMWVIQATYLVQYFPFTKEAKDNSRQLTKDALQLPESLKDATALEGKTAETIQKEIQTAQKLLWFKSFLLIALGIISGCLLILHRTTGYLLSLLLSFGLIFYNIFNLYNSERFSFRAYALLFQYYPLDVIRDVIMFLVLLITIVVLTSAYVGKKIKRNEVS